MGETGPPANIFFLNLFEFVEVITAAQVIDSMAAGKRVFAAGGENPPVRQVIAGLLAGNLPMIMAGRPLLIIAIDEQAIGEGWPPGEAEPYFALIGSRKEPYPPGRG